MGKPKNNFLKNVKIMNMEMKKNLKLKNIWTSGQCVQKMKKKVVVNIIHLTLEIEIKIL